MTSYLLRWNPDEWPIEKFAEFFRLYERGERLSWACGNTKKIKPSDRFFLMQSGREGRGLIGSGEILSAPYLDSHFNDEKADEGETRLFVDLKFDYLVKPGTSIPVLRDELNSPELTSTVWDTQGGGKTIPDEIAWRLDALWRRRVEVVEFSSPDEIPRRRTTLPEGTSKTITVNAYERNPEARRRCINKWGYKCAACSFDFEKVYGPLGKNYIHVHHLTPLSSIGAAYQVDPERDLRPVCPNCHAMLHATRDPLSIEELRDVLARHRTRKRTESPVR